jgi:hypothetical protein
MCDDMSERYASSTYVIVLINHLLGGGGGLVTSDGSLMNIQVDLEDLEATQQIDEWHWKDSGKNHRECNGHDPIRIMMIHSFALDKNERGARKDERKE